MRLFATIMFALVTGAALAAEAPAAPPDDSTVITLTYGELQQIIAANIKEAFAQEAQAVAQKALRHLKAQIDPKPAPAPEAKP